MAGSTRVTVVLSLKWGPQGRFVFHVASTVVSPTDPIVTGLITVLEAVTRGKAIHIEISLSAAGVGSATVGADYVNEDKALMRFLDDSGVSHAYKIPGLLPAILEADKETVDPVNADVSAYTAAVLLSAKTRSNDVMSTFVSGHRTENRKPIKAGRV